MKHHRLDQTFCRRIIYLSLQRYSDPCRGEGTYYRVHPCRAANVRTQRESQQTLRVGGMRASPGFIMFQAAVWGEDKVRRLGGVSSEATAVSHQATVLAGL